jgi:hypothetical protein
MASIRSGMFHIDTTMLGPKLRSGTDSVVRKVQMRPIHRGAAPPREPSASERLSELLLHLFRTGELHEFVRYNFPDVTPLLPERVSPSDFALAVVDRLGELGKIDRNLFERLARVRPDHRDKIDKVAHLRGLTLAPPSTRAADSSARPLLHERLLALSPAQLDAVMYLAGFVGDRSANETRALRERPRISARELARAFSEGPEAIGRLADAIDLVTTKE